MPHLLRLAAVAATAAMIGGCAVTPKAITKAEHKGRVAQDLSRLFVKQEPISGPVTLQEAVARALKYNLDKRVKLMEEALARNLLDRTGWDLLPQVTADAGYNWRNNNLGSNSESLLTGAESLEVSTSQERHYKTSDLGFSWNILDFGVSYMRAKQDADRVLVAEEQRRKVVQSIVQEVRTAYWRAVAAQRLLRRIGPLMKQVRQGRKQARAIENERLQAPLDALSYQRDLLDTQRQLHLLQRDMIVAKVQLAALMNLPPEQEFELRIPERLPPLPRIDTPLKQLERLALEQRPELRQEAYQKQISEAEVRKELLRTLPGIEIDYGMNYNSNEFLYKNHWQQGGVRVVWNLLNLLSASDRMQTAEAGVDVAESRRMALNMAVLAQVHVAYLRAAQARHEYKIAEELSGIEGRILRQMEAKTKTERSGSLELIRGRLGLLIAQLRRDLAYAELSKALGQVHVSIGRDPVPETLQSDDLQTLTRAVGIRELTP